MRSGFRYQLSLAGVFLALMGGISGGLAQPAPPPAAPAPDPRLAAAQKVFEALGEAERKAIQTDLIWSGDFSGTVSGSYGPLTFRAINAIKAKMRGAPDGILSASERKTLADAARQARAAIGFETVTDSRSGVRLGLPKAILPKTEALPTGGSRWQSIDGKITLDTRVGGPTDTLQAMFEKVSASTPGRNVSYKVIRPDFYVVSGETAGGKFFSRMAGGPAGIRGFSIGYDKSLSPAFDRVVVAIANSFEPFPGAAAPAPAVAGTGAPAAPVLPVVVRATEHHGTGLIVGPNRVLTASAALEGCKTPPRVAGKPGRVAAKDDASGLVLLEVEGVATARPAQLHEGKFGPEQRLVVIAMTETAPGQRATAALPGMSVAAASGLMARAPLQPGGAGSPAFDAQGRLAGLITGNPSERFMVAGVAVQRSYRFAASGDIEAFLARAGIRLATSSASTELTTGAVVEGAVSGVVGVSCGV
jgi:peptidoglycan hydrolase-like protein with peptidoglycan-binding domain